MTEPTPYELFAFWRTSATYRVRVALNLKGVQVSEHIVNIDAGEHRSAAFLAINPLGAIPALRLPGQPPLTQSLAILEFLDEQHPQVPLLPADASGRARVRSIALMLAADTHPLITPRVKKYLIGTAGFDDAAWRAWQVTWFTTGLQALEQRLVAENVPGRFVHGESPGLADICLASILVVMRVFGISVPHIPRIEAIMAACEALPAFQRAAPYLQAGAPAT